MKKTLLGAALLSILAGSCTNENIAELEQESRMVCIEASHGVTSRTGINGNQTVWQEGDQIYVSSADGKCYGTLTLSEGANSANGIFKGFVSGKPSDLAYSVFPVPRNGKIDLTERPANNPDAPMIATFGSSNSLSFDLTCGMVAIKINGAEDKDVTLTYDGMKLGGSAAVVYNAETKKYELEYTRSEDGVTVTDIPSNEAMVYVPVITSGTNNENLPTVGNINITVTIGTATATINVPVVEGKISLNQVPEITYTGNAIEKEGTAEPGVDETAEDALRRKLTEEDVVTLDRDVELTSPLTISGAKVIDLAGFTIKNATSSFDATEQALVIVNRGGSLTINDSGANGQIVVDNNVNIYNAIKMTASDEKTGAEATLVVNGGKIEGTYYGISGNGTRHGTSVTINGGTIGCSGAGCGIFQPQEGELFINAGEIYGKESAVEVRAGKLIMNGGTLNCATTFSEPQKHNSGTTMRGGVALGVARHTENKNVTVEIKGGTLTGTNYGIYEFSQDNATGNATLTLTDPAYDIKVTSAAVIYNVSTLAKLQEAVNFDAKNISINLSGDITGNVTVTQKPDVKIAIDGKKFNFAGVLLVDGKSATYTTAGLTIKNLNFKAESISADACIQLGKDNNTRYTCNVTVDGCTFDVPGAVGIKSYTGGDKNLTVTGCTATTNAHSLLQAAGIDGINVNYCIINSVRGLNFNQSNNVTIDYCNIDVNKYAVRFGASSGDMSVAETYSITNSTLKSANDDDDAVIVLRGTANKSTLTITNTTIEGTLKITNTATGAKVIIDGVEQ